MKIGANKEPTQDTNDACNLRGSIWHRWDPHIHIPGTLHNDNFGKNADDEYVKRVNATDPAIRALGITEYYVLDSYKRAVDWHKNGRIPNVKMIFPNIELRFAVNAGKGSPINVHLLVSPEDSDHIEQAERFLNELTFKYDQETYRCSRSDLVRLGYAYKPDTKHDQNALKNGTEQFKVDPDELISAFEKSAWARVNILVAIAASSKDGTAQLQAEGGLTATRRKLQQLADVIFSSKESDREYWLGETKIDRATLDAEYGGPKPCLHGCDAHDLETVGNPKLDRYCWLKGDLTFETLRQACIEPKGRAFVNIAPPSGGLPSNTITCTDLNNADWIGTPKVQINPGLVAVIGARGSGKTALVELIAAGANSINHDQTKGSFLGRASDLIGDETVTLHWGSGDTTSARIHLDSIPDEPSGPRVRYLSQQFVDRLCSSDGLAEELVSEIERVIFQAHTPDTRYGASSFAELRETMTAGIRRAKERYKIALADIANEISIQLDLYRSVGQLERKRSELSAAIERDKKDRKQLTPSENKTVLDRLDIVRATTEKVSQDIAKLNKQHLELSGLKQEAEQFQNFDADNKLRLLKTEYPNSGLSDQEWGQFKLTYDGDIDALLDSRIKVVSAEIETRKGPAKGEIEESKTPTTTAPYMSDTADLSKLTLSLLEKEQRRLEAILGVDATRRKRYTELSDKIVKAEAQLVKLDLEIINAKGAEAKITELHNRREESYRGIFGEIVKEERMFQRLYQPLEDSLKAQKGTLNKLTFSVKRDVDLQSWADAGESYLDVRKQGIFRGKGSLYEKVEEQLLDIWQTGDPQQIAESMSRFRSESSSSLWNHVPDYANQSRETKKTWFDKVSAWLFSTDHIEVIYGLQYEEIDIHQLSPGTRGIVLLLLYLSIDREDDRPLIIDQPEENLDPKSIFDELVERFKEVKTRRQVIIVTHNANLVVNTDADQVIVASRGAHRKDKLPLMTYQSGGLENPDIRRTVCEILEGGEAAFKERARRLRVSLPSG